MITKAKGDVQVGNKPNFIIEGHGRVLAGQTISKVVPGKGRCWFTVSESGALIPKR
jgi:hypothetical protein